MTRLLISGDTVIQGPIQISSELKSYFGDADHCIFNLEAPVTESKRKLHKTGPSLKNDHQGLLSFLTSVNPTLFCLANNHIGDFGQRGIIDTLDFCIQNQVAYTGITDTTDNYKSASVTNDIAVLNVCENEWSTIADKQVAQGYQQAKFANAIKSLARTHKVVIIIYHGGHEYYNLPSPRLQERFRNFIDSGADLVVSHHTHVFSGKEAYNNKQIYYGLGNFLFAKDKAPASWNLGLTLDVRINADFSLAISETFTTYNYKTGVLDFVSQNKLQTAKLAFEKLSQVVADPASVHDHWNQYVHKNMEQVLWHLSPVHAVRNPFLRKLGYLMGYKGLSVNYMSMILNYSRCEALSELSQEVLIGEIKRLTNNTKHL